MEGHRYFTTDAVEGKCMIILGLRFLEPSCTCVILQTLLRKQHGRQVSNGGSSCNESYSRSQRRFYELPIDDWIVQGKLLKKL